MIEDGSEDFRLEVCPDNVRSAEVLLPLIKKHVCVGSTIHTDHWRAYLGLSDEGYIHRRVNHSDPDHAFVSVDGVHTQRIESSWRPAKDYFRSRHIPQHQFADHLVEYQWRRELRKSGLDAFQELIRCIKAHHPVN